VYYELLKPNQTVNHCWATINRFESCFESKTYIQ